MVSMAVFSSTFFTVYTDCVSFLFCFSVQINSKLKHDCKSVTLKTSYRTTSKYESASSLE